MTYYRLVRAKVEARVELAATGDEWWKSLTKAQQESYIKLHPNSKYAKKTKIGKARNKLIKGVGKAAGDKNVHKNRLTEQRKERAVKLKNRIDNVKKNLSFLRKEVEKTKDQSAKKLVLVRVKDETDLLLSLREELKALRKSISSM